MTSETAPTTSVDVVRQQERINTAKFLRLRRKVGAITLAATTLSATFLPLEKTASIEIGRFGNMNVNSEAPFVIQPEICRGEIDINEGIDIPTIVETNKAYEEQYADEKSSAKLKPDTREAKPDPTFIEELQAKLEYLWDAGEMGFQAARGAFEIMPYVMLNERIRYRSELTGMEIVVSGPEGLDFDPVQAESLMGEILNPDNYEHSQLSQLMACAQQKLVTEQIHRGNRLHIVFGEYGETFKNFRFQTGEGIRGIALPTNLVPAPDIYKSEVLIAIAPGTGNDKEFNMMLAHEWQHTVLHLIDHPIRLDPNEKQATLAADEVALPWIADGGQAVSLEP